MSCFFRAIASFGLAVLMLVFPLTAITLATPVAVTPINAQNLFNSGVEKTQSGDYEQALLDFTQAIRLDANLAAAYSNRCLVNIELGDYQKARQDCTQALQRSSNNSEAYLNRGLAHYRLSEHQAAIADYSSVIKLNPHDFRAYYNRGLAYFAQENYQEAIADYNQALHQGSQFNRSMDTLPSTLATIHNDRGIAYLHLGDFEGADVKALASAIADFSLAIDLDASNARAYYNRACAYHRRGHYIGAIRDFTQSLQHDPYQAEAYVNRGLIRHRVGYYQAALEDLRLGAECFCQQGQITAYQQTLTLIERLQQHSHETVLV